MVAVPKEVADMIADKASVKVLVTASKTGRPHAIVCGSIFIGPDGKAGVAEILMKRAKQNLAENAKAAISVSSGPKSYELVLSNPQRVDSGPIFENMKAGLAAMNLPCFAVWLFDVCQVWDESAGPTAGTKIA
jgi:hypothetical protein